MDFNEANLLVKYSYKLSELAEESALTNRIEPSLYDKYDVKRGLRESNGKGVLCGLTEISDVISWNDEGGKRVEIPGILRYQGIDVKNIIKNCIDENRFGFEETVYLLLFGKLPNKVEFEEFCEMLSDFRTLPRNFVRDIVMKSPSNDMMNMLARCVLNLYSYDPDPDNIGISNVLRQCIQLIAQFPMLAIYSYRAYRYYDTNNGSLIIHKPKPEYSTAQNILHMLRKDSEFTDLEAKVLDIALILHADHGGGNNSTFTTHVVTSSGTDTYSSMAASLGSLKGPKHGGANIKVMQMMENIKENIADWSEASVTAYIDKILKKEAFDHAGLIYGMGHAVYTLSDPRAEILKLYAEKLAIAKGRQEEYRLYETVEKSAKRLINEQHKVSKPVCANVDLYSGFVYSMLNLPQDLYTPLFAISRVGGWSAHRMEELINGNRIIRPSYRCVKPDSNYKPMNKRK